MPTATTATHHDHRRQRHHAARRTPRRRRRRCCSSTAAARTPTMLAGQAESLAAAGYEVVTYDRRGTGRSGREDWPGGGAAQHADDAAALIDRARVGRPDRRRRELGRRDRPRPRRPPSRRRRARRGVGAAGRRRHPRRGRGVGGDHGPRRGPSRRAPGRLRRRPGDPAHRRDRRAGEPSTTRPSPPPGPTPSRSSAMSRRSPNAALDEAALSEGRHHDRASGRRRTSWWRRPSTSSPAGPAGRRCGSTPTTRSTWPTRRC